ncbi:zinc finger protein 185 isoform X2 [Pleuronectes platessa]|uniref:zinc finger protein 185 isoform X2 n=1 Tax=Pleuronectes platessa TaxID=8262 RepID=UPI00232A5AE0|nr:zinc finger protein 185 isoform X2 [Pleuronectes platessa]
MSKEGNRAAVFSTTKVRTKLKGDGSWLQRTSEPQAEAEEEVKPWLAEVRANRVNGAPIETSPGPSPTKPELPPNKPDAERAPTSGYLIRGIFTKLDEKTESSPTSNGSSGTTQFNKKASESYKRIAPHTVRPTSENQEDLLSNEEQEKRTEAASNVLKTSSVRQRSYVLSAAKKFELIDKAADTSPVINNVSFVAKRVEIVDDDEEAKTPPPVSSPSPVAYVAPAPTARPRGIEETNVKTAADEPVAPKVLGPLPHLLKEDPTPVSVTQKNPFEGLKPGCTKVATPLPELIPVLVEAVHKEPEPKEPDVSDQTDTSLVKITPDLPNLVSTTPARAVPESPARLSPALSSTVPKPPAPLSPALTSTVPKPPAPLSPALTSTVPKSPAPLSPAPTSTVPKSPAPLSPALTSTVPKSPAPLSPAPTTTVPKFPAPLSPAPTSTVPKPPAPLSPALTSTVPKSPAPLSPALTSTVPKSPAPLSPALTSTVPKSPAPLSPAPTSTVPKPPAPLSPALTSTVPKSPAPLSPALTSTVSKSPAPLSPALTSTVPKSPAPLSPAPTSTVPKSPAPLSPALTSTVSKSPAPLSPALTSTVPKSPAPLSPAPTSTVPKSPAPLSPALTSTVPKSPAPLSAALTSTVPKSPAPLSPAQTSTVPKSPAPLSPALTSTFPKSPAPLSPAPTSTVPKSPAPLSPALTSTFPESLAPVSTVTTITVMTEPEEEPEPQSKPSPMTSSRVDTLAAFYDTLVPTSSTSLKDDEPELAKEQGSPAESHSTESRAAEEPDPVFSIPEPMTDDLLAFDDGPQEAAVPVPQSPGRWSQDLLSGFDSEPDPAMTSGALDLLATDVIPFNTERRSPSVQREEEKQTDETAGETQSHTETVTVTTRTVIITDQSEEDKADPWSSHMTTVVTESSSADPFDPYPIGTTSPNSSSDLLQPLADISINSTPATFTENKDLSPEPHLGTQRSWARTWDTITPQQAGTEESQEAEPEDQAGDQQTMIMFERKSKENDSPWDRWTSPTVYTITTEEDEEEDEEEEEEEEEESSKETRTETVTTVTTIREIHGEPEPAMDRYQTYTRSVTQEERPVQTPEPETKKPFVYLKEYVNTSEESSHNARDETNSGLDYLTSSSTSYSYSSPSTYPSGPMSSSCTFCGKLVGDDAKITIEHLNINCHPDCFKCGVCDKDMGDLLCSMFLHGGKVHCESCYSKALD